jgi:hypothetical protein
MWSISIPFGFDVRSLTFLSDMDENSNDNESLVARIQQLEHGMCTCYFWH